MWLNFGLFTKVNIKTKLHLNIVISTFLILILIISILLTSNVIRKESDKQKLLSRIEKTIFETDTLINDYILYREERAVRQWETRYKLGLATIQKAEEEEEEEEEELTLTRIKAEYVTLGSLFSEFYSVSQEKQKIIQEGISQEELKLVNELEKKKLAQLLTTSQSIKSKFSASELEDKTSLRLINSFETSLNITIFIIIILLFIIIATSLKISKSITKPIEMLIKASEKVAKGNFKTKINLQTGDEFQVLGETFNKTAQALDKLDKERKEIDKAKTQLLAISSHELRSPMTTMKAQLQMLLEDYFGRMNKKQKESVDTILRNTNHLDRIIVDLLEVSRMRAGRVKLNLIKTNLIVDTNKLIKEMEHFLPEKNIEIVLNMKKLPAIKTDPDKVMQVLRNLIDNAKKFSKKGSKVFVTAEQKDGMIQFSVKDQGIGISSENQKKMFKPIFQSEQSIYRKYSGTGLGMTICKGIIEELGGRIWFESELGKGSTFYFSLPLEKQKLRT